tara:strand:- start:660 stop:911 length:252 start_codon:yes stop_codon:yes gene_type:complete
MSNNYDDFNNEEFNPDLGLDWYCQVHMGIDELRILYGHVLYAIETWPGAPRRPYEEQEYLLYLKQKLFAMIMDYQYSQVDMDK